MTYSFHYLPRGIVHGLADLSFRRFLLLALRIAGAGSRMATTTTAGGPYDFGCQGTDRTWPGGLVYSFGHFPATGWSRPSGSFVTTPLTMQIRVVSAHFSTPSPVQP